ncbi:MULTISPECIES: NAD(P)(+) transhydrogenase (Re/Si-specific) subunit beta [unclassified Leptolyngbya]|uniref:NAD(P)(+) transhydrogenase (Re/Si-specific) subunit beta n=1 Tax=unclassified Leptolyngbya TaxID=2650499 RepID=UPI001689F84F|nr:MULTISPECIES: NAD(P)(+) transhydrogenase (Re/Si-specific) subunit beta [unclassified Leptolyngbya]MBD1911138.1 NAD(P)(+) transhydrogenase (Re/Si-specific) subunit beta [Leptolyngbya sp. FACHB-8]MBD2154337.1 NAD(P)(+) transhydrogenase (Re/Si-specific) subunit beta [Leptolyngbya sp. FACHB-16]
MTSVLNNGIELGYLVAVSLFIVGLKRLGSPATARKGNSLAAVGMLLAIAATLLYQTPMNFPLILAGILVGSVIGIVMAQKVEMTAMPQMVGLLNGLGGGASTLVAAAEFERLLRAGEVPTLSNLITILLSVLIGGVTLTGSLIAFAKLQGIIGGAPVVLPMQRLISLGLVALFLGGSVLLIQDSTQQAIFLGVIGISLVLGVLFTNPIGGADMPVVISLLNSFSGLAASAAGFVLMNNMLIVAGALVGASGIILTQIMCKAMNRSLTNVLFTAFNDAKKTTGGDGSEVGDRIVHPIDSEEAAMMLGYAQSVVIVPGYGMAVAQAQHTVRELADQLGRLGVEVKYAIHPVAGRMPGHMNVLLAEANVPYPQLYDMEDINPEFERVDVALVIGANDVVNPAARSNAQSPIYGMPILEVDKAHHTIVIKRGMSAGFAGVENELFYDDKTMMLFGNARDVLTDLVASVKQL